MSSLPSTFEDLMMAQQPIYDLSNKVFAYELLFRNNDEKMANVIDGENATCQVLVNLCIGITELEAQMRAPFFINITRNLLTSDAFFPIDSNLVYIEILEDQEITPELIYAVERWHREGYRFALDDYNFDQSYDPLLLYTSIIKIDVLTTHPKDYKLKIEKLISQGFILLAEKVEDQNMYDICKDLGFSLFQGYYLKRPNIVKGKRISSNMSNALELVKELQNQDITIDKVTILIRKSPTLSYQLLRLLNSPICGIQRQVTSLSEAVVYLGLDKIRKWAILITITSCSKQSNEIFRVVLIRAKCCENLSIRQKSTSPDSDFMAGIMSGIDLVLNIEKDIVFGQISIDNKIIDAIHHHTGNIGERLKDVLSYENYDWDYIMALPPKRRLDIGHSFAEATIWAEGVIHI